MIYLNWLSVKFFGNPCLFFWRCGWCYLLLWNLWILDQFCSWNLARNRQNRTKDAPGEAKIGPRGYPPEVPKNRSNKKTRHNGKQSCNRLQNGIPNRKVGDIVGDIFRYFPASFLGLLFNCSFNGFGSAFCINFMIYLDVFGYFLKLAALAKSAPRRHGSMVFEVLTLRFLIVFSWFSCYFPW